MNRLIAIFLFLSCSYLMNAQNAGVRAYAGITNLSNRIEAITPEGTSHNGFHFGADGRLNSGDMFFVIGLRYTKVDLIATSSSAYFGNETNHSIFSGRIGLGWHLIHFGKGSIRAKILGQFDNNVSFDKEALSGQYGDLVDASAGGVVGFGIEIVNITLDLEYEYALVHTYSQEKDTKADALTVSAGFFF